jgi:hypothetical protein
MRFNFEDSSKGRISFKKKRQLIEIQSNKIDKANNADIQHSVTILKTHNKCFNKAFHSLFSLKNDNFQLNFVEKMYFWDYDQILIQAIGNQIHEAFQKSKDYNFICVSNEIIKQSDCQIRKNLWTIILESFKLTIKSFIAYIKIMPGLSELNQKDLEIIVKEKLFEFFIIINLKQFVNGECYVMLPNGQHFKTILIENLLGHEFLRITFEIVDQIKKMKMNCKELSLLLSIILTNFGMNKKNELVFN